MKKILIVDDEINIRKGLKEALKLEGYESVEASHGKDALEVLLKEPISAVISDLRMPVLSGYDLMKEIKRIYPQIPFIVITGHGDISEAVEAMQKGAYNFLTKPIDLDKLFSIFKKILSQTQEINLPSASLSPKETIPTEHSLYERYYSHSAIMQSLLNRIKKIAPSQAIISLSSEPGNEIDWIAQTIWFYSSRKNFPFFKIDCASLSLERMEEELFGKEDINGFQRGRLELSHKGTIFWQNIHLLTYISQNKLINLLKSQSFERMGGNYPLDLDIRFIFYNSAELKKSIDQGLFRKDLYEIMNTIDLQIPSLSQRKDDIPYLCESILRELSLRNSLPLKRLSLKALKKLKNYPFQRNIEELFNILKKTFLMSEGSLIEEKYLPYEIRFPFYQSKNPTIINIPIGKSWSEIEKIVIQEYLKVYPKKTTLSQILKISRRTLYRKIEEYSLEKKLNLFKERLPPLSCQEKG